MNTPAQAYAQADVQPELSYYINVRHTTHPAEWFFL